MNGWKQENGNWCYYNNDTKAIGWFEIENRWYYSNADGIMQTGWVKLDEKWYYLYEASDSKNNKVQGEMATGWLNNSGYWYYLNDKSIPSQNINKGVMQTGWVKLDEKWYYLIETSDSSRSEYKGQMVLNCTRVIGNKDYTFNADGSRVERSSLVSDECINFVKSWEGFYSNKYIDCVGVETQGYGLTGQEIANLPDTITEEQASSLLKELINSKYAQVIKDDLDSKGISLSQNEFDALASMSYNVGTSGLLGSTLYKNICAGIRDSAVILSNFQAWSNGNGTRIEGLYRRRTKEGNMFITGDYTGNS